MDFSEDGRESGKKLIGIAVVVLIHVLLIYALINGLGKQIITVINQLPIQTMFIEPPKPAESAPPTPVATPAPPKKVITPKPAVPLPQVDAPTTPTDPSPDAIQAVTADSPSPARASVAAESTKGPVVTQAVVDFATCKKPDYPRNALRNEEQGTVRLQFLIGLDGHVAESRIDKSSGFRTLDMAAKKALSLCKFKPGTVDGKPQQSWTVVDYVWRLPD